MIPTRGLGQAILGALLLGAVQTLGDLIWALYIPRHQVVYGLLHGAILCLCLGLVLGAFAGSRRALLVGALGELAIGLAVSGGFYGVYLLLRRYLLAMVLCWMALWILTGLLDRRLRGGTESSGGTESWRGAILRGVVAAVGSGLAFWAISGVWTEPQPDGPNYAYHLAAWTFAFLPGFLALCLRRDR